MDSREKLNEELRSLVASQAEQLKQQAARIEVLELELANAKKDSTTSSKPPSGDIVKPKVKAKRGSRKMTDTPGGQPGHQRKLREPLPPERVDEFIEIGIDDLEIQRPELTATAKFVREARDVQWIGPPGTGKSHHCQGIGNALIRVGVTVYYRSIFDVARDFMLDESMDGTEKILGRHLQPDLLIIDDMGMKQLPKRSGKHLFEVIMRRNGLRSTMMTSNRPLEEWGKLLGDAPSAAAILDRFLADSEVIQLKGRNYRLNKSKKNSNSTQAQTGSTTEDQ